MRERIELLSQLVGIDSVNPALVPGAPGETAIARFVQAWCDLRHIHTEWIETVAGRPSLIARVTGTGGGRSLMLYAHLDTVGTTGMQHAHAARIEGNFLHGRGACDMKASLSVCLRVLAFAGLQQLAGDVILIAVSDEEHSSIGTRDALTRVHADAAIVTEPSAMQLCLAHRGFAVFDIEISGMPSHTSQPQFGANAVTALGRMLSGIEQQDQACRAKPSHALLGHGSAQAVLVNGGSELFTTPAQARVSYERRTLPGETPAQIRAELDRIVQHACASVPGTNAHVNMLLQREPFETEPTSAIAMCVASAAQSQRTVAPQIIGAPFWMDSALIAAAGIPTVVYGPTAYGIHSHDERVDLTEVAQLEEILETCIVSFCC